MPLVQAPTALDGGIGLAKFLQGQPVGFNGALQETRVHRAEAQPGLAHDSARRSGFGHPLLSEGYVVPAGEEIEGVPRALAVAEEDQGAGHGAMVGPNEVWQGVTNV